MISIDQTQDKKTIRMLIHLYKTNTIPFHCKFLRTFSEMQINISTLMFYSRSKKKSCINDYIWVVLFIFLVLIYLKIQLNCNKYYTNKPKLLWLKMLKQNAINKKKTITKSKNKKNNNIYKKGLHLAALNHAKKWKKK